MFQFSKNLVVLTLALTAAACNNNTAPGNDRSAETAPPPSQSPVTSVEKAINEADRMAIEPSSMTIQDYKQVVGESIDCKFQMTAVGMPILVAKNRTGALKINGKVVELESPGATPSEGIELNMSAGDIHVTVTPLEDEGVQPDKGFSQREANLVFDLKKGRKVGYQGFYLCRS